ncbi:MAG: hypothetical protein R3C49_00205 [Planctomycetaceae bacterium]
MSASGFPESSSAVQTAAAELPGDDPSGPPPLPGEAEQPTALPDGVIADELPVAGRFAKLTAASWVLSLLLHIVGYTAAAIVFAAISRTFLEPEDVTPLRASLDDFDRQGEQPKFEMVVDLESPPGEVQSSMQRWSSSLRTVENGMYDSTVTDLMPSVGSVESTTDDEEPGAEFLFRIPESGLAVTKGSFTVWTDPEVPSPNQFYRIIIEVRLKDGIQMYRINDLSGWVVGSDRYRQKIPFDSNHPNYSFYTDENMKEVKIQGGSESIKVRGNKIQLVIRVEGASRLVQDTITISSRRLREKQELELVFGGRR